VAPLPYGYFKKTLPHITVAAHSTIEAMQPYYPTGHINNALRFINELSNIDKHRHLALTRARSQMHEHRTFASGWVSSGTMALDHGTEIDLATGGIANDATLEVNYSLATFVTFNEPMLGEDACTVSVQHLLELLLQALQVHVVPAFR